MQLSDFSNALEKIIQPYIQDNVPTQARLLQVIKRNDNVQQFNNNFYAPIRSGKHSGIVNLANENAKLRTGFAPVSQASIGQKILTGTFDFSDVANKASQGKLAVQTALKFQAQSLSKDFAKNINRQYFSDGVGVLAQVAGSVGAGTLSIVYPDANLDDGRGDAAGWYGPINYDIRPTKYFAPGNAIGIGTAAADVGTITATGITGGTAQGTLVVTGGPAINANDAVYLVDGDENAAGTSEIQGIRSALSVGTADYAGIARSLDIWSPQYAGTASNAALSVSDMDQVYMNAIEYAQTGDRYAWFCNKTTYVKYGQLLTALRRTVNKSELVSGWSGLEYEAGEGNVAVYRDFDCPDGEMILLNLDTWTVCQVADMSFVEDNALRRSDYITFQKVFSWYTNLLCVAPAANGRLVRRTR